MITNSCAGFHLHVFQERAAGALANLAADDKCSMEVALAGGVHALVMLARNCKFEGVQEQVRQFPFLVAGEEKVHDEKCCNKTVGTVYLC